MCEKMFIVSEGVVDIIMKYREKEFLFETIGVGSSFGMYGVMLNHHLYPFYVRAKTNVTVQTVSKEILIEYKDYLTDYANNNTIIKRYLRQHGLPFGDFIIRFNRSKTALDRLRKICNKQIQLSRYLRSKQYTLTQLIHDLKK